MSGTKRSFWKFSLPVFANVSYETLILEDFFVGFCECLVRNACFGMLHCPFLRMSRTKRSFWKVFLSAFCECLVRNALFGRLPCPFLRTSRTKRSFWKVSLSVFANVSHETLILEDFLDLLSYRIFSHLLVSSSAPSAPHLHNLFFSSHVLTDLITCSSHHIFIYIICSFSLLISSHIFFSLLYT